MVGEKRVDVDIVAVGRNKKANNYGVGLDMLVNEITKTNKLFPEEIDKTALGLMAEMMRYNLAYCQEIQRKFNAPDKWEILMWILSGMCLAFVSIAIAIKLTTP